MSPDQRDEPHKSHPLAIDAQAASASTSLPGFLARPRGAPVYHGFPILDDVEIDGFCLGMITDWEAEEATEGDAFIVAPDGSRAGLVWDVGKEVNLRPIRPPEPGRWGVWSVTFPGPMRTRDDARVNLAVLVPILRPHWEEWRSKKHSTHSE
jgi:hypothetical protein